LRDVAQRVGEAGLPIEGVVAQNCGMVSA
jgi:hypothetical protein